MDDKQIIELYWNRDEEALVQTSRKYGSFCFSIAKNILNNEEDSKECVNDTWFRAWTVIPPKRPDLLQAFLGRITRNLSLDRYRKSRAAKRGGAEMDLIYEELENCIPVGNGTEEKIEEMELAEAIGSFLSSLPHDARILFVRRYWYADSILQIANRYKISESKVKSSLMRSRGKLRAYLEQEGITL